jgi:hypothetical protein
LGAFAFRGTYDREELGRDIDGDGKPDKQEDFSVVSLVCRDLNGDGYDHVVATTGMPADLTALDVDGDKILEVAVVRSRDEGLTAGISIYKVSGTGKLTRLRDFVLGSDDVLDSDVRVPYAITSADMDSDGRQDIVAVTQNAFGSRNGIISVIRNNGDSTFSLLGEYKTVPRQVTNIIAADVTGDGLPDIILTTVAAITDADWDGSLEVFKGLGNGRITRLGSYNVGRGPVRVAAAPMDTAKGLDLVVANDGSNEITLLLNDGKGLFPVQERYLSGGGTDTLAVADFDGDGNRDVAVGNDWYVSYPGEREHYGSVTVLGGRRSGKATGGP